LHLIDLAPIDESNPVDNARIILGELEKYSDKLYQKPRWLVFNKADLLDPQEAASRAKQIADDLGWEGDYYLISAASQQGVKDLCWDVMKFINTQPKEEAKADKVAEKVEFMWDDYHRETLQEHAVEEEDDEDWDDWDDEDEEGVEIIYQR
jgi:Predicted GTPase